MALLYKSTLSYFHFTETGQKAETPAMGMEEGGTFKLWFGYGCCAPGGF